MAKPKNNLATNAPVEEALQAAYLTLAHTVKGSLPAYFIKIPLHQLTIILQALTAFPLQDF